MNSSEKRKNSDLQTKVADMISNQRNKNYNRTSFSHLWVS